MSPVVGDAANASLSGTASSMLYGFSWYFGKALPSPEDVIELPLRKPTVVFCGHGQTMHTGMDHTFSRK